jgi:hypothetical protein
MDVFGRVFAEESRLNVVLHRTEYGHKGWTNFEQQIIKARCLGNEGWTSFALLQVDDTPVPSWVPPTYIYGDANMGVDVLAGVLKHRAKMAGANVANETAPSRLARLANKKAFEADTEHLATGPEAHAALRSNLDRVFQPIAAVIAEHSGRTTALDGATGLASGVFGVNLGSVGCFINHRNPYGRVTGGHVLVRLFRQNVALPGSGQVTLGEIPALGRTTVNVIRSPSLGWCWEINGRPVTSDELADYVLDQLIRANR